MYLEKYVGHYVIFKLTPSARNDKTMRMFYNAAEHNGFIRNKLVAVDELGIWVEGVLETTILADDEGNKLQNPITEWITYHVLVKWEFIEGIHVVDNPKVNEKRIGFDLN